MVLSCANVFRVLHKCVLVLATIFLDGNLSQWECELGKATTCVCVHVSADQSTNALLGARFLSTNAPIYGPYSGCNMGMCFQMRTVIHMWEMMRNEEEEEEEEESLFKADAVNEEDRRGGQGSRGGAISRGKRDSSSCHHPSTSSRREHGQIVSPWEGEHVRVRTRERARKWSCQCVCQSESAHGRE